MRFGPAGLATFAIAITVLLVGADKAGLLRDAPRPPPPSRASVAAAPAPAPAVQAPAAPAAAAPAPAFVRDADDVPEVMPEGADREEVFYFCTACHGSALIRRQGISRERWDGLLTWMTERHGMAPLEGADRERFLDYLASAFPPRQREYINPFLRR